MGTKHTPGPWETLERDGQYLRVRCIALGRRYEIANVLNEQGPYGMAEQEANARLIAASPRLLEALRKVLREAAGDALDDWYREAELAVAEAEGRQS